MRVLVFGTFDRLHLGHSFVLLEAMRRGDVHVVIARDRNVERIKGRPAMESEEKRAAAVRAAFPGLTVLLGDPDDFLAPVRSVQPDLILLGYDQQLPPGVEQKDLPGRIERLPAFEPGRYKSTIQRTEAKDRT